MYTIIGKKISRSIKVFGGFFFPEEEKYSDTSGDLIGMGMGFNIHTRNGNFSMKLEDSNNSSGETVFPASFRYSSEVKKTVKSEIEDCRNKLKNVENNTIFGESSFIVEHQYVEETRESSSLSFLDSSIILGDSSSDYIIIFNGVAIFLENLFMEDFDFRNELNGLSSVGALRCAKCNEFGVNYMTKNERGVGFCSRCTKEITLKCAEIGGNQKVENDIIVNTI